MRSEPLFAFSFQLLFALSFELSALSLIASNLQRPKAFRHQLPAIPIAVLLIF
jgi:hypothetical protein